LNTKIALARFPSSRISLLQAYTGDNKFMNTIHSAMNKREPRNSLEGIHSECKQMQTLLSSALKDMGVEIEKE
jgi:hypothetical protein